MVRIGVFTGIDRTHIYIGRIEGEDEQLKGYVERSNYPIPGFQPAAISDNTKLNLDGKQNDRGEFQLFVELEGRGGQLEFTGNGSRVDW